MRSFLTGSVVSVSFSAALALAATGAQASTFVLDFEGLGVLRTAQQNAADFGIPTQGVFESVDGFYNGGTGGDGSGPGENYGVEFSSNALAIRDADSVGLPPASGNFGGEPTPDTVLFFLTGSEATMTFRNGFRDGFSFYYSSINFTGEIVVYSGPEATGDVLARLTLPRTQFNGAPDPTGQFSPFEPLGVSFPGVAQSIDFGGTLNQIGFDNITFGSATPLPTTPTPPDSIVPLPASLPLLLGAAGMLGVIGRKKLKKQ